MIDAATLTKDLRALVLEVEEDLRGVLQSRPEEDAAWKSKHGILVKEEQTALAWTEFRDGRLTQVAVAWVLATVFVRFVEDNSLVAPVWLAGPTEGRRQEAQDAQLAYFRQHPEHTGREWIRQTIRHLETLPATRALVQDSAHLHLPISGRMADRIIAFWREDDPAGGLVRDFTDDRLDTRFLGDLYQDLSEYAQKTFALKQTPVFVEEFILDRTLEPALAERPLEGFRVIDPTCGSGHFLLGAFDRVADRWAAAGATADEAVDRALESVVGVDINPFATAIARFRLAVAALQRTGEASLETASPRHVRVLTGDSLLQGRQRPGTGESFDAVDLQLGGFFASPEEIDELREALRGGSYDAVVGNPPYITVKDKALNQHYRRLYPATTKGGYALSAPFLERFFDLARPESATTPAGWTGQITANSFMKREFGVPVVEKYLPTKDLELVIDTSGAYIPGHGTPTVILVGRNAPPRAETVRAVLGIQGEPGAPQDPAQGKVWRAIADHVDEPGYEDQWVSVLDVDRASFGTHPWSLQGGASPVVTASIEANSTRLLGLECDMIGGAIRAGADDVFMRPAHRPNDPRWTGVRLRPFVLGDGVRDWSEKSSIDILLPYSDALAPSDEGLSSALWPWRSLLAQRSTFQGSMKDAGLEWWEYQQFTRRTYATHLSIAFAEVATHNHFVLDRGGKVFKQTAPVIKLPAGATEDDHFALLGVLNSSVACFWLKQNCQSKHSGAGGSGMSDQPWSWNYAFNSTNVGKIPLPSNMPIQRPRCLDELGHRRALATPAAIAEREVPRAKVLAAARAEYQRLTEALVAEQEELDWENYQAYGFTTEPVTFDGELPSVRPGERAFEIALARRVAAGKASPVWFTHAVQARPMITEIPERWPADYRALVQRRLDLIEVDRSLNLLERPEYKRRWAAEPWDKQVDAALRTWLLDRLDVPELWQDRAGRPTPRSIAQLADPLGRDADFMAVLRLWSGAEDISTVKELTRLLTDEAVPYLAALRFKESGLRKFRAWQHTWELQRRQDAGEDVGHIPAPPTYSQADTRKATWWKHRGKLDVPKERFILYPDAGREGDPTLLLGWAGWDHAQQALALNRIMDERLAEDASAERLVPLVAGLAELQPWVEQWHAEEDPAFGLPLAEFTHGTLEEYRRELGVTAAELDAWRPAPTGRGRRKRT